MENNGIANNLAQLINLECAKRITLRSGAKVTQADIIKDIAQFCKISPETVKAYKNRNVIPSLPIAIRLADYFRVQVTDIFSIVDYDLAVENKKNAGRKKGQYSSNQSKAGDNIVTCKECGQVAIAKGLCMRHYQQYRRKILS